MKNLNNTLDPILFSLPFGGFYESMHSEQVNVYIDQMGYDWEKVNFNATYLNYSKALLNYIESEINTPLKFIGLNSPKFYNFTTDKIEAEILPENYAKFIAEFLTDNCKAYINEACKSRDGFTSFYPTFEKVASEPSVLIQYIFEYLIFESEELELMYFNFEGEIIMNDLNPTQNV